MTEEYQALVLATYKKMKETKELNSDLSTRAKFRKECLKVFNERYHPKDDDIFAEFFDVDKMGANFHLLLKRSVADDFKAVHNHIVGNNKTDNTDLKNTELLAWLIDFQPRPSTTYYKSFYQKEDVDVIPDLNEESAEKQEESTSVDTKAESEDSTEENDGEKKTGKPSNDPVTPLTDYRLIFILIIIILLAIGKLSFYIWEQEVLVKREPKPSEKCMYWTGYDYEPISCDKTADNSIIIPLDLNRMKSMKKLPFFTKVTKRDIGRLWWGKIDGRPEYFTDSGIHPVDTTKRLLPLSAYMVAKYETEKNLIIDLLTWIYYITIGVLCGLLILLFSKRRVTS
ncbi:hypothetical protein [Pedobacter frigidisoli]|uniref:hypothetical protein n=1 Tax=Pedobacter frigidisoli TaxID=2530455 RepID=UPI00292E6DB9|nr:hypothetical protein [Pedobacter frigidisoli]